MSIVAWLFFSIVITYMASLVANAIVPIQMSTGGSTTFGSLEYIELLQRRSTIQMNIQRISPAYLYNEAASSILGIAGRTLGFIGLGGGTPFQQLELIQGLITSGPPITAIAVGFIVCFAAAYALFLCLEIRPGG